MLYSNEYNMQTRNTYVRFLVKLLTRKYDVVQSRIAQKLGINPNYFRDFSRGDKDLNEDNIERIEYYLTDLYEGIFLFEIPQDKQEFESFVLNLKSSPIYEKYVY